LSIEGKLPARLRLQNCHPGSLAESFWVRILSINSGALPSKKQLSGRGVMKMISKRLIALALMSTIYSSSSWAITWDAITDVVGNSDAGDKNFTAPNGALGEDKGVTKQLRVPTGGIQKKGADFKGSWNGQISFIHADNKEGGSYTCKYKNKTGGYYVFTIQR
jgi:hypothetical protein